MPLTDPGDHTVSLLNEPFADKPKFAPSTNVKSCLDIKSPNASPALQLKPLSSPSPRSNGTISSPPHGYDLRGWEEDATALNDNGANEWSEDQGNGAALCRCAKHQDSPDTDTKCVFDDNQRHGPRHDSLTTSLTEAFATHRAGLDGTIQKHLHPLVKKIENLEIKLEAAMQLLLKRSSGHHDGKVEREQEGNNNHIV